MKYFLHKVTRENIDTLKTINAAVLPVRYTNDLYTQILKSGTEFSYIGKLIANVTHFNSIYKLFWKGLCNRWNRL